MSMNAQNAINWVEQGYIPDSIIRKGIQRLLRVRLKEIQVDNAEDLSVLKNSFIEDMRESPIATMPDIDEKTYQSLINLSTNIVYNPDVIQRIPQRWEKQ